MMALALAFAGALPPQWNAWKWSAPIAHRRAPMESITIPPWLYSAANADLSDVRIIDANGRQVPYTIVIRRGSSTVQWDEARLDDYGFLRGQYTQVVATAGVPAQDYTAIELSTPKTNFATTVDVYASGDRRHWRSIRLGAHVFDFESDGLGSNTRVAIPPSHSRYYRIEVRDGATAFPVDAVSLAQGAATPPELSRYTAALSTAAQRGTDTVVRVGVRYANLPVSLVRVDTKTPLFLREATVQASSDGILWTDVAQGVLERTAAGEVRSIRFNEVQARYWRVRIANGEDAPLRDVRVELWGTPRHVVFAPAGAADYRMIFGNATAHAPLYDFAAIHRAAAIEAAAPVSLKPATYNSGFRPPAPPWSERHPWVLWVAFGVAMAGVGLLAIRTLLAENGTPDSETSG